MGHRKHSAPRHGSLGVRPRKRASKIVPRVRSWPDIVLDKPKLLGYAAYKAGMTHILVIDDRPNRDTTGKEIFVPVTILDAPPMLVLGIRAYKRFPMSGLLSIGEVWRDPTESLTTLLDEIYKDNPFIEITPEELTRKYLHGLRKVNPGLVKPENGGYKFVVKYHEEKISKIKASNPDEIRVIMSTIPVLSGIGKKKPEIVEIKIGGGASVEEQLDYAVGLLGKYVAVWDVFREGQFIDVIGVTKGKGFQGVVKRFGVKELPRWHKHRKGSRKIGSRSPGFGTMSETPQAGQMGFHRRTEYNKRIIKVGKNGWEITPKGGFLGYGIVFGPYLMLHGSVIGVRKRLLVLREPIRPPEWKPEAAPEIVYVSHESKQGV